MVDFLRGALRTGLGWATGGATELMGEDSLASIPVVGGLLGAKSDEEKALAAKQEEMARETKRRQVENQRMRMQSLGQQMLAFNPRNQMMAQMFGPEAAFNPQQFAQMANDPGAKPIAEAEKAWLAASNAMPVDPKTRRRDPNIDPNVQAELERARENERRKRELMQNMQPVGPGPAPLAARGRQPARRF